MVAKRLHVAEAANVAKKSRKTAKKVVIRKEHGNDSPPSFERNDLEQPALSSYERMSQLLASRDAGAG